MADEQTGAAIEDFLVEDRTFPPPESFKKDTLVASPFLYDEANEDWQGFWARQAADLLDWDEEWHTILEWDLPFAKWFVGGKLNVCHNAVDRHVARRSRRQGRVPLGGRARRHPHDHLRRSARRRAALRQRPQGPRRSPRAIASASTCRWSRSCPVAMLACARIGAPHSVVFGGFSPDSLIDRINDAECKVVITADGGFRRGAPVDAQAQRRHRPRVHAERRARRRR